MAPGSSGPYCVDIPQDRRESMNDLIPAMEASVGYFIIGQGLLCLSIGAMALVAYLLIGLPTRSSWPLQLA